ncbi:MAG TPA: SDR family oxidoreductase [bacterium]|nr:SDR family oxidoreductase [bacterium]
MKKILIVGATSAIARETARCFAAEKDALFLVARDAAKLEATADDLKARGAERVETFEMDANDFDRHGLILHEAEEILGGLDVVFIAHGTLPDQKACEASFEKTREELSTNFLSIVSLVTLAANDFEKKGTGTIAVVTSVAGDRGRPSNYIYGAAKGATSLFLSGLRARLFKSNVAVVDIRPGFVDTPMTASIKKNPLFASPEAVGRGIYKAILKKKDVVYLPGFWCLIMTAIRMIPERIFKRLRT